MWAKSVGNSGADNSNSIAVDVNLNSYVVGSYTSDSILFGNITLVKDTNSNTRDLFIVKYDSLGNVIWAKNFGGTKSEDARAVCCDVSGSIFVAGVFTSPTIIFGSTTLINNGFTDFFIVKLDQNGTVVWAKSEGGSFPDFANSCAIDKNGNIFVGGVFTSQSITIGNNTYSNIPGDSETLLIKYDSNGNVIWSKISDCADAGATIRSIAVDINNNVYISGEHSCSSLIFGTYNLINTNNILADVFIVKYDGNNGAVLWAKNIAGGSGSNNKNEQTYAITTNSNAEVIVAGFYGSPSLTFGNITITNNATQNIFIVKYDSNGNSLWAKSAGGNSYDYPYSVCADLYNNIYVTGAIRSTNFMAENLPLATTGGEDVFVLKYNTNGNISWVASYGSSNNSEYAKGICTDIYGNIYLTGDFKSSTLVFDSFSLNNNGNSNTVDMFAARLGALTIGINNILNKTDCSIYPNPFKESISIQTNKFSNIAYEIYDVYGKKKMNGEIVNENTNVPMNVFSNGIYYVQINEKGKQRIFKIIKQK